MRLVRDSDLPATTRAVGWAIGLRASMDGTCMPSYERIAKDAGLRRNAAVVHVKTLRDSGWLLLLPRANGKGSQTNVVQLLDPRLWKTQDPRLWKTQEVVSQEYQVVSQEYPLRGISGIPRSVRPIEVPADPPAPVENRAVGALIHGMSRQSRIPS
jgi:Helix-turn-helix domain